MRPDPLPGLLSQRLAARTMAAGPARITSASLGHAATTAARLTSHSARLHGSATGSARRTWRVVRGRFLARYRI
jgi:hypothetical protein